MILYFLPFNCIGNFQLGEKISKYYSLFEFEHYPDIDNIKLDSYEIKSLGISLYVNTDNGLIESICCNHECLFKGRNLIGMTLDEFISHTEEMYNEAEIDKLDFEDDNIPQYVYEFENIGLEVWVKKDVIVTVIAGVDGNLG